MTTSIYVQGAVRQGNPPGSAVRSIRSNAFAFFASLTDVCTKYCHFNVVGLRAQTFKPIKSTWDAQRNQSMAKDVIGTQARFA